MRTVVAEFLCGSVAEFAYNKDFFYFPQSAALHHFHLDFGCWAVSGVEHLETEVSVGGESSSFETGVIENAEGHWIWRGADVLFFRF